MASGLGLSSQHGANRGVLEELAPRGFVPISRPGLDHLLKDLEIIHTGQLGPELPLLPMRRRKRAMLDFDQEISALARNLIGARLLVRGVGGTVLETEAYGRDDPASHSFRGMTSRNAAMFRPPGSVYVYLSYGCHLCLNVVGRAGEAVLIRAILPEVGVTLMEERRGRRDAVASGPGRVGQALGITLGDSGKRFGTGEFMLEPSAANPPLLVGTRIGITRAADRLWRFGLAGSAGLSRSFPPSAAG